MRVRFCFIIVIYIGVVCLNIIRLNSSIIEKILVSDLANNKISMERHEIGNINYHYPGQTSNLIPISTLISRYYLHYKDFDKAITFGIKGVESNPYLAYTNYLLARIYIEKDSLSEGYKYMQKAYELSPNIESISQPYNILKKTLKD
jgi:tetratricopeptide (TPR) repeat protein